MLVICRVVRLWIHRLWISMDHHTVPCPLLRQCTTPRTTPSPDIPSAQGNTTTSVLTRLSCTKTVRCKCYTSSCLCFLFHFVSLVFITRVIHRILRTSRPHTLYHHCHHQSNLVFFILSLKLNTHLTCPQILSTTNCSFLVIVSVDT